MKPTLVSTASRLARNAIKLKWAQGDLRVSEGGSRERRSSKRLRVVVLVVVVVLALVLVLVVRPPKDIIAIQI